MTSTGTERAHATLSSRLTGELVTAVVEAPPFRILDDEIGVRPLPRTYDRVGVDGTGVIHISPSMSREGVIDGRRCWVDGGFRGQLLAGGSERGGECWSDPTELGLQSIENVGRAAQWGAVGGGL